MIALGMNKYAKLYSQTRGRQSLLFDQQKAADVDLATIYAIGCQGLCASAWSFSVLVCTQMIDRRRLQVWMHYVVLMLDSPLTEKVYSLKLPQASVETSRLKKPLPKSTRPSRLSSAPFRTTSWLLALSRPWSISFAGIGEGSQTLIMIHCRLPVSMHAWKIRALSVFIIYHITLPRPFIFAPRVNEFNVEALLLCALPYHNTNEFVRLVQTLALDTAPGWAWLTGMQTSGAALTREVLVQRCSNDKVIGAKSCIHKG